MKYKTFELIRKLEEQIESGFSLKIFKGYVAIDKRGVEKIIDELYSNLPIDVLNARKFLKDRHPDFQITNNNGAKGIYDKLEELEINLNSPIGFAKYIVINIKQFEEIIDSIYTSLPEEIIKAKNLDRQ